MERSDELRVRGGPAEPSGPFPAFMVLGDTSPSIFRRLLECFVSSLVESRRCNAQRRPLSTPVLRPTVPTVFATGDPILRSMNSAPDLKRGEYDFDVA